MATNFDENAIVMSGGIKPSTKNTPTDVRTRIESISEVELIPLPFVGMIFFVKDEEQFYVVKSLKGKKIGPIETPDSLVDEFEPLFMGLASEQFVQEAINNVELIQGMNDAEDIETKSSQDVFYNVISTKQEILDAKEDVVVPENTPKIGEILRVSSNITNTDYKVSYNKILVKGDITVEMLYLEAGDTENIFTYTTTIPFTGMIEFDNISENYRFDIKYTLRNLELVLGENNMLTISAEVLADATMFEETKVDYVNDFYSTNSNLNYDKSEVAVIKNKEVINVSYELPKSFVLRGSAISPPSLERERIFLASSRVRFSL